MPTTIDDEILRQKWLARADSAKKTLALKAEEAAKGHDWVVAHEPVPCTDLAALGDYLSRVEAEIAELDEDCTCRAVGWYEMRARMEAAEDRAASIENTMRSELEWYSSNAGFLDGIPFEHAAHVIRVMIKRVLEQ